MLYEMLTGAPPFQGSDLTETLAAIVKDQPDLTKVPAQVRRDEWWEEHGDLIARVHAETGVQEAVKTIAVDFEHR